MSDKTRRETATTGTPHPARHPLSRQAASGRTAVRTVPRPDRRLPASRARRWPDARTAEALLAGGGTEPSAAPPAPATAPADRLARLLSAAREVSPTLDPDREAAALAAFRDAAARRAGRAGRAGAGRAAAAEGAAYGRGAGAPRGTLRAAFAVRRPRIMVAAVASALALGGVAVGMATARTSPPDGGGSGTSPLVSRPPAAVSPDGGRTAPPMPAPAVSSTPVPSDTVHLDRHTQQHQGRACGRSADPLCPPAAKDKGKGAEEKGRGGGDGRKTGGDEDAGRSGRGENDARGAVVVTGEILSRTGSGEGASSSAGTGYQGFGAGASRSPGAYGGGSPYGTAAPTRGTGATVVPSAAARQWHGRAERQTASRAQDSRTRHTPRNQWAQAYG